MNWGIDPPSGAWTEPISNAQAMAEIEAQKAAKAAQKSEKEAEKERLNRYLASLEKK